jgi:hypothetical protein
MRAAPRLSIGLPVYNGEKYLTESLDALLGQSFEDFELIISDNASTDDTARICKRYMKQDCRIRYIRQQRNIGAAPNHNFVVGQAAGELFKWASGGADRLRHPAVRLYAEYIWGYITAIRRATVARGSARVLSSAGPVGVQPGFARAYPAGRGAGTRLGRGTTSAGVRRAAARRRLRTDRTTPCVTRPTQAYIDG